MIARTIFSEEHEIFRSAARRFIETEMVPHHRAWERAGVVPRELWRKAGEQGLLCPNVKEAYGGNGGDWLSDRGDVHVALLELVADGQAVGNRIGCGRARQRRTVGVGAHGQR